MDGAGLQEGGGNVALLTFNGRPIAWGLLERGLCGVTKAHCGPTTDQDPRVSAQGRACSYCVFEITLIKVNNKQAMQGSYGAR